MFVIDNMISSNMDRLIYKIYYEKFDAGDGYYDDESKRDEGLKQMQN